MLRGGFSVSIGVSRAYRAFGALGVFMVLCLIGVYCLCGFAWYVGVGVRDLGFGVRTEDHISIYTLNPKP